MFIDAYENVVAQYGDKLAYIYGKNRITYSELDNCAQCITAGILQNGFTAGDRVGLRLTSTVDFAAACIGIWRAGGVVVPIDTGPLKSELSSLLNIAQLSFIVIDKADESLPPDIQPLRIEQLKMHTPNEVHSINTTNRDMLIIFSSGTTGKPKGIVHTHESMSAMAQRSIAVSGLNCNQVLLATSLHNTGFGLNTYVLEPLLCGATVVVVHPFHPRIALDIANKENVSWIHTVPTVLNLLLSVERSPALPSLQTIRLGAATLDEKSRSKCKAKFGIQPIQGYGMSEIGRIACTTNSPQQSSLQMTVHAGIDLKIIRDDLTEAGTGQVGEIGAYAASLCRPYYLTENGVQEPIPVHDGYFMTGDLGKLSVDGLLKLMGRSKTFILTPRFKVDPGEVEHVLLQHPEISDVAVVPAPGKSGYELIKAILVTKADLAAEEVMSYCSKHLPQGKCPQIIEFIHHLPRNKLGKVEIKKL